MRYKVLAWIEADPTMGWDEMAVRDAIEDAFRSYGDVSASVFCVAEPIGCDVSPVSSRGCERGTRGCETRHVETSPELEDERGGR